MRKELIVDDTETYSRPWILVTNDDGADSPALAPLLRALSSVAPVGVVVPAAECSWTAKVLSRFAVLAPVRRKCAEFDIWVVDGYPADCANLGIHSLFPTPPALVVSGVNMGANAGLAFLLSSGTVGAAMEAVLAGIPASAFSVQLEARDFGRWRRQRLLDEGVQNLLARAATVTGELVAEIFLHGLPGDASLLTVNMPSTMRMDSPRRLARVTTTDYGAYFASDGAGRYTHRFSGLRTQAAADDGDVAVLERGEIALTPLRFHLDADVSSADRRRFEGAGRVSAADL